MFQFEKSSRLSREAEDQLKVIPKFCFPDSLNWEPSSHMPRSGQTPQKSAPSNRSKSTREYFTAKYLLIEVEINEFDNTFGYLSLCSSLETVDVDFAGPLVYVCMTQ